MSVITERLEILPPFAARISKLPRPIRPPRHLLVASLAVLGLFYAVQVALILSGLRGAFLDEGIYITAGLRILQGHGRQDSYDTWIVGSAIWPVLAALGFKAAGLHGARIVAATLVTLALLGATQAVENLFGRQARFWATLFVVVSGPVLALAHLAVYDVVALVGISCALWATTELHRRDNRLWLVLASLFAVFGALGKYPTLIFAMLPLTGLIIVLRAEKARLDLAIFGFLTTGVLLVYFLQERGQLSTFLAFRVNNNPSFGVTQAMILFSQGYFLLIPIILALAGIAVSSARRKVGIALLIGVLLPPAYHLLTGSSVGDEKHAVFGVIFALPLIGALLARVSRSWFRSSVAVAALAGLGAYGTLQMVRMDKSFPDPTRAADVLRAAVRPGQRLLINNAWPYTLTLYAAHRIRSPYDVYDAYRLDHGQANPDLCSYAWFVDAPAGSAWSPATTAAIRRCGTFRVVYQSTASLVGLGHNLHFLTYSAPLTIWRNFRLVPYHQPTGQ